MRLTSHRPAATLAAVAVALALAPGHAQTKRTAGTFGSGPQAELHVGTACAGDVAALSITFLNVSALTTGDNDGRSRRRPQALRTRES